MQQAMRNFSKILSVLVTFILLMLVETQVRAVTKTPKNAAEVKSWIDENFARGKVPPFSFHYKGKSSDTFIAKWNRTAEVIPSGDVSVKKMAYTYADQKTGLSVRCEVAYFTDFPAVEWTLHFSNLSGNTNSQLINELSVINYNFPSSANGAILHSAKGSNHGLDDFMPLADTLIAGRTVYKTPSAGRSSDTAGFPFFNLQTSDKSGVMMAIGWTGKWNAHFTQKGAGPVQLQAGLDQFSSYLLPNEKIRSPKICLLFWSGDNRFTGHNEFRKLILAHYTRKVNNEIPVLPFASFLDRDGPQPCNEHVCATESHSISEIRRHKQFNLLPEAFWTDAGWYPCGGLWTNVGEWTPNKDHFPNGLKPVADEAHANDSKYLLWFEPERYTKGNPNASLEKEHPEWLVELPGEKSMLFDLGNPDARIYLTNQLSEMIKKTGIDYYRQDFNFDPLPYWKKMDKPNRQGISEIRHIEGLYAFWDSLLVRFPNLIIDNCASGGRRLDLETTARSTPFWRTDYAYGEPIGSQSHTYALNLYLPLSGTGCFEPSAYHMRSAMGSNLVINWDVNSKKYKQQDLKNLISEYKLLRPYYYHSDYYPLTGLNNTTGQNIWLAYQMNKPKEGDGIVVAFRRPGATTTTISVNLQGLESSTTYELTNQDTQEKFSASGHELSKGLVLKLDKSPGSLVLKYRKL